MVGRRGRGSEETTEAEYSCEHIENICANYPVDGPQITWDDVISIWKPKIAAITANVKHKYKFLTFNAWLFIILINSLLSLLCIATIKNILFS